ncbi:MAG: PQQ-dependent sugar dehydrogenase [Maricaulis sp.]|uniref:PQQ-dependent sugar dehydrogenase n=1 Tax=Maricaulis sp. TaxID=1486257 RepID=UPI002610DE23|nr:PQQ-dependent sugar dehydrogenase [Maricaulis sp.]MDM7985653.1 PQQ-dependent sugar dehydrogenase [Maricaulis sp.]
MRIVTGIALFAALSAPAIAQPVLVESEEADFAIVEIASGLEFPWSIAPLASGDLLVSEREGYLSHVDVESGEITRLAGLPDDVFVGGQGGMLGLAIHPDFDENRLVYFAYSRGDGRANHTSLARGRLSEDHTRLDDVENLFDVNFEKRRGYHFGGRVQFLADRSVLLTTGDGGSHQNEAQNLENHLGTVVRINDDGSVPFDNPFATTAAAQPEIYSYGHRNIQGIALHPTTGRVWTHEHGPRGGDEINIIRPGDNYGWPVVTYGINYNGSVISEEKEGPGLTSPIWQWTPSLAPSGMAFYSGEHFPQWEGDLLVSTLAGSMLLRYEVDENSVLSEERMLTEYGQRLRDVVVAPDGYVYLAVDDLDGRILRLEPVVN